MPQSRSIDMLCDSPSETAGLLSGTPSRSTGGMPQTEVVSFLPGLTLRPGRVHEGCGAARQLFAAWVLAAVQRNAGAHARPAALWIRPGWQREAINPHGLAEWADPGALVMVNCPRAPDLLWCAEEALRAGSAALVVVELPEPPALTPVRRLHLAAETGVGRVRAAQGDGMAGLPLGLVLISGDTGAPGVESRWHLAPCPSRSDPDPGRVDPAPRWRLARLRARSEAAAAWHVMQGADRNLRLRRLPDATG